MLRRKAQLTGNSGENIFAPSPKTLEFSLGDVSPFATEIDNIQEEHFIRARETSRIAYNPDSWANGRMSFESEIALVKLIV